MTKVTLDTDAQVWEAPRPEWQDYLRAHGAQFVHERSLLGPDGLDTISLWADGVRFASIDVDVTGLARRTLDPATGLAALQQAQEQLALHYLIREGLLHPKEALP